MSESPVENLRITEIFFSLQGEAKHVGAPTVFVRLTGCPLRCGYCDSEYAFYGGEKQSIDSIVETVKAFSAPYVCVTGGEPLAQPGARLLLERLCESGCKVSLETSGALPIDGVDRRVSVVMDIKTPGSGEVDKNRYENVALLKNTDQVKFVICDRSDYEWARFKIADLALDSRVEDIWFSPAYQQVEAKELAEWILQDRLPVRLQLQLHKLLWGDKPGV